MVPWKVSYEGTVSEGSHGLEKYCRCRESGKQNKPQCSSLHAAAAVPEKFLESLVARFNGSMH